MIKRVIFSVIAAVMVATGVFAAPSSDTIYLTVTVESDTIAPVAPSGLSAAAGDSMVNLSWNANSESDLAGYNVYRSETQGGPYTKINVSIIVQNIWRDSGLTNGVTYYYVVSAVDNKGNESNYSDEVSAAPECWIKNVYDIYDPITPNGDGAYDSTEIRYLLTKEGRVTIKIYDSNNTAVRTLLEGMSQTAANQAVTWDGKDDYLAILPDGDYTYRITATDSESNTAQAQSTIMIDNHYVQMVSPANNSAIEGIVTLTSQTSGNFAIGSWGVAFQYRLVGSSQWNFIGRDQNFGDNTWQVNWDTTTLSNGNYEVVVIANQWDRNGNRRDNELGLVHVYTIKNAIAIKNIYDIFDPITPNGDGAYDSTEVRYLLTKDGSVTIKIYDAGNTLVRTLINNESQTAGNQTVVWNGKNDSAIVLGDGEYTYKIEAVDSAGNTAFGQSTVMIDNSYLRVVLPADGSAVEGIVPVIAQTSGNFIVGNWGVSFAYRNVNGGTWVFIGADRNLNDNSWQVNWDTRILPDGNYEVRATINHIDRNGYNRGRDGEASLSNTYTIENSIAIKNVYDIFDPITPNGDGAYDSTEVRYLLTKDGSVTIKIYDAGNTLVRTLINNESQTAGNQTVVWNGKNDSAIVLGDGEYTYKIEAVDSAGNTAFGQSTVMIDNSYLRVVLPADGSAVEGIVPVTAQTSGNFIVGNWGVSFAYRNVNGGTWVFIGADKNLNDNTWQINWNTTILPDGNYELRAAVNHIDRNGYNRGRDGEASLSNTYTIENAIAIKNIYDIFDPITPNGDGAYDSTEVRYLLTKDGSVTIKIYDAGNTLVRTLINNESQTAGNQTVVWNGKNDSAIVLGDGEYTYKIEAVDSAGNTAFGQSTVMIDNNYLRIVLPADGSAIEGIVPVIAQTSGNFIVGSWGVSFAYRNMSGGTWVFIGADRNLNDNSWQVNWDTRILPDGNYELRATINHIDRNGYNRGRDGEVSLSIACVVSNVVPEINNLAAVPNPFSPDESGTWINIETGEIFNEPASGLVLDDIAAISFTAACPSFFDIKILDDNDQLARQLIYGPLYPGAQTNIINLQWDGRSNNGGFVKNGQYKVVVNPGSQEKEKSIVVTVDKMPFITNTKIAPNPFSPDGDNQNDTAAISYNLSDNAYVTVEIYDQQNILVRKLIDNRLLLSGNNSHIWDGKDEQGNNLFEGKYTVKISTKAETGKAGEPAYINIFLLNITDIRISDDKFNPYLLETAAIFYKLSIQSVLSIKVYNSENVLVRNLIANASRLAGDHSEIWDGKNDNETIVSDGAYYFTIEDSKSGIPVLIYDPRGTDGRDISKAISLSTTDFDSLNNKYCLLTYNQLQSAMINLKVRSDRFSGPAIKVIKYLEPSASGQHQALWDGREETGNFVEPNKSLTFALFGYTLNENSLVVTGGRPQITNPAVSPVRFSPYRNFYESNQIINTIVSFNLSREAYVDIKIYDSLGNLIRVLADNLLCSSGQNSFAWDDRNQQGIYVGAEYYRIIIQANYNGNYSEAITLHSEIY